MYTLILKCRSKDTAVFNVYDNRSGKQRVIGNIFCTKKNGRYIADRNQKILSVVGNEINEETLQKLYHKAERICSWNFR